MTAGGGTGAEAAGIGGRGRPSAAAICAANAICCWADEAGAAGPAPAGLEVEPRLSGVGVRALKTYNIQNAMHVYFANITIPT